MMRKTPLMLLGAAAGAALTLLATQPRLAFVGASARAAAGADTYRQLNLFGDVFERVRADYVEKPDDGKLIESAVNGMLNALDPHSSYMDAKSFRDIITHLDDEPVQGLTLNQAVDKMRGPVNTKIRLKIMRKGQDKPVDVSIVRDIIRVRSVRSSVEGGEIGYIRITQFNEQTTDGLKKALTDLSAQIPPEKLKGFVVDLRNNPGGLLDQAISVSDAFLERGEIVSTRGRNAEETQ